MPNLAEEFLDQAERDSIAGLVQQMEQQTSGEIVPLVVSSSYSYPTATIHGAALCALAIALPLGPIVQGQFWLSPDWSVPLFLAVFLICYLPAYWVIGKVPGIRRFFLSRREVEEEVREGALTSFFQNELYRTKERNGILLYISVLERRAWILADEAINARVAPEQWQAIIDALTTGIRENRQTEALKQAILQVGTILQEHFPASPNDTNELEDLLVR